MERNDIPILFGTEGGSAKCKPFFYMNMKNKYKNGRIDLPP
jgi:hypothetical protein